MESMKKINWNTSKIIADEVDARIGECLANVVRAFLDYSYILPEGAVHVEGIYSYGGQFKLHTWIETPNSIIDLSMVRENNKSLRDSVRHFPIQTRDEKEIKKLYGDKPRSPGGTLQMELNYDDPRVIRIINEFDTPPGLRIN